MLFYRKFATGETVPASGIYRVLHSQHRLPHEVTLIGGHPFPRCQRCDDKVEFEMLHSAEDWPALDRRDIVIYELPEIADPSVA